MVAVAAVMLVEPLALAVAGMVSTRPCATSIRCHLCLYDMMVMAMVAMAMLAMLVMLVKIAITKRGVNSFRKRGQRPSTLH